MSVLFKPLCLAACIAAAAFPAHAGNVVTGAQDLGAIPTPTTQGFVRAFNDTDPGTAGLQLAGVPGTVLATDTFYEDYAFQISGTTFSSITATIDLGSVFSISNLQARLYQGTLQTTTTGPVGSALLSAWSAQNLVASSGGSGSVQVVTPIDLAPGSYVFEVRGNITGDSGGSFAGVLNFASPVPEPDALALALAGLAALGLGARRPRSPRINAPAQV